MSHRLQEKVRLDLIEADVDMAFALVDDAREEFYEGDRLFAERALKDAKRVLHDIDIRLRLLEPERMLPFTPLIDELRKFINLAEAECG